MPGARIFGPSGAPGAAGLVGPNVSGATSPVLPAIQTILNQTETVILNPSLASATQALVLSIPPNTILENIPFSVMASGYLNNGGSTTVTLKLYSGTSTTVGSDTVLTSSGAVSAFSGKANWFVKATLVYDTFSGKLSGMAKWLVNNTITAEAAISNVITGVSNTGGTTGAAVANFVLSVTYGTGATNVIRVMDFGVYDLF